MEVDCHLKVKAILPGQGMSPKYLEAIIGKTFNQDISAGSPVSLEVIG